MSKAWSHLPNAHHIDWVLASLKENPELWDASWSVASDAAWEAASDKTKDSARQPPMFAAWDTAWGTSKGVARAAVQNTILVLIAYDDCDQFLSMSYERLKVWATLSEDPRAVLLLPMVYVKEKLLQEVAV